MLGTIFLLLAKFWPLSLVLFIFFGTAFGVGLISKSVRNEIIEKNNQEIETSPEYQEALQELSMEELVLVNPPLKELNASHLREFVERRLNSSLEMEDIYPEESIIIKGIASGTVDKSENRFKDEYLYSFYIYMSHNDAYKTVIALTNDISFLRNLRKDDKIKVIGKITGAKNFINLLYIKTEQIEKL